MTSARAAAVHSDEILASWPRGPVPDDGLTDADLADAKARQDQPPGPPAATAVAVDVDAEYPDIDWPTLWNRAGAPVDWLCEPLLIAGRAVAVFSPAKAGKSLLCLEIAAALATGRPVLGNAAREPLQVVYVDLENIEEDILERLTDLGYGPADFPLLVTNLHYKSFPGLPALDSPKGGAHLRAIAEHYDARLVVIDTVSRVVEGPENEADTFRDLYRYAITPLKAAGRAVLRLDHSGRDVSRGQRGSTAKVDDLDAVWRLTARPGGAVDLHCTHRRHKHGADRLALVRLSDPLRHMPGKVSAVIEADVQEVIDQLDRLEIPTDWGRDRVKARLLDDGIRRGNDLLAEALRTRKQRAADLSGTGPADHDEQTSLNDHAGQDHAE